MSDMIELIKDEVSIYDLFDRSNPRVKYDTDQIQCQISCPFHGYDTSPSARVYPESNSMYCWTCARSWDVIDFWAEINQWEKEGRLDRGKAIKDLAAMYGLKNKKPDWQKSLYAALGNVEGRAGGYDSYNDEDRKAAADAFAWRASRHLAALSKERRATLVDSVLRMWDDFDSIDLEKDGWRSELKQWLAGVRSLILV